MGVAICHIAVKQPLCVASMKGDAVRRHDALPLGLRQRQVLLASMKGYAVGRRDLVRVDDEDGGATSMNGDTVRCRDVAVDVPLQAGLPASMKGVAVGRRDVIPGPGQRARRGLASMKGDTMGRRDSDGSQERVSAA